MKAILGVELGFVLDLQATLLGKTIGNLVLLAETDEGYQHLMKLTAFANQEGIAGKPKIDLAALKQRSGGLVALSGGRESRLGTMLAAGESQEKILEIYQLLQDIFGKNCYLEIIAQKEQDHPLLAEINQLCLSFAEKTGSPCLINNVFFYPQPSDKSTRELALAIKDNKKLYDQDRRKPAGLHHIMTEEEIRAIARGNGYSEAQITAWLEENLALAERLQGKIRFGSGLFPKYHAPQDIIDLYEQYKTTLIVPSL